MNNQAYVKNTDAVSKFDSKSLLDDFKIKTDIVTQKAQSISTKPTFLQCRLFLNSVFFTGNQVRNFNKRKEFIQGKTHEDGSSVLI